MNSNKSKEERGRKMNENKINYNIGLIAVVAIVAIVAIIILFMQNKATPKTFTITDSQEEVLAEEGTEYAVEEEAYSEDENLVGEAKRIREATPTCINYDGGKKTAEERYKTAGYAYMSNNEQKKLYDTCSGNTGLLLEARCTDGVPTYVTIDCKKQFNNCYTCLNGACKPTECKDNDAGRSQIKDRLQFKGYAENGNKIEDYCKDNDKLMEAQCNTGTCQSEYKEWSCSEQFGQNYICYLGACVSKNSGIIKITSPSDGLIYVDNSFKGKTTSASLVLEVSVSSHTVVFAKENCQLQTKPVSVARGQTVDITFTC